MYVITMFFFGTKKFCLRSDYATQMMELYMKFEGVVSIIIIIKIGFL